MLIYKIDKIYQSSWTRLQQSIRPQLNWIICLKPDQATESFLPFSSNNLLGSEFLAIMQLEQLLGCVKKIFTSYNLII